MTTMNEENKRSGFEACCSMMSRCFGAGDDGKKGEKFNFSACEQMMKSFCSGKDGKVDFGDICSKMETFCKTDNREPKSEANAGAQK